MVIFAGIRDVFDLSGRQAGVTAPTLVIGGKRDAVYSPEIFARTAQDVQNGRLILYRGATHATTL